jgi:hypothetical protein
MEAIERLSIHKARARANLHQPDYVPKKKFGFRTINSPSNLNEPMVDGANPTK